MKVEQMFKSGTLLMVLMFLLVNGCATLKEAQNPSDYSILYAYLSYDDYYISVHNKWRATQHYEYLKDKYDFISQTGLTRDEVEQILHTETGDTELKVTETRNFGEWGEWGRSRKKENVGQIHFVMFYWREKIPVERRN
jgi:hypothetical protein